MKNMRIDHKVPEMQQTFNTWLSNLNLAVHVPPTNSGPLLFCPHLSNEENPENLQEVGCSDLQTTWNLWSNSAEGERQPVRLIVSIQLHVAYNSLSVGTIFVSIILFFIYSNKYLRLFICQVLKQNLRGYTCRTNTGSACTCSSCGVLLPQLCTRKHILCNIWCQGAMGNQLWATEILLSIVVSSSYGNLTFE